MVPSTSHLMRNTVLLVGSAQPARTSIPTRSQAYGNGVSQMIPAQNEALIIVPAAFDQARNAVFLVGSAHPTKTSIRPWGRAWGLRDALKILSCQIASVQQS